MSEGPLSRAARLLGHREAGHSLAIFRMAVGLIILHMLGALIWTESLAPIWMNPEDGGLRDQKVTQWLAVAVGAPAPSGVLALVAGAAAGALALTVGLGARIGALLTLQCLLALFSVHQSSGGGHDRLILNALWLLVLASSDRSLSLRSRLQTGRWWNDTPVAAWPRWLAVFQICLVYTATGLQKVNPEWFPWGGLEAVYRSLLLPSWARYDLSGWLGDIEPLLQAATALTWLWESSFFLVIAALYWRATRTRPGRARALSNRWDLRRAYLLIGIAMHLGLTALMELGPFGLISMSFYACMLSPDEWSAKLRRS